MHSDRNQEEGSDISICQLTQGLVQLDVLRFKATNDWRMPEGDDHGCAMRLLNSMVPGSESQFVTQLPLVLSIRCLFYCCVE